MYILGISALYHDSAAVLVKDGEIIAGAQEERFTRIKHDKSVPGYAIKYCLDFAQIKGSDIDAVVYYDDPIATLDRWLANASAIGEERKDLLNFSYKAMFQEKLWIAEKIKQILGGLGRRGKLLVVKHHMAHAASAFYPSPYEKAAVITVDGVGEWNTTTIGFGKGNEITILKKIDYPHSLGLLYSAFTYFCGFKVNYGDYKLMGLAPYGEPIYYDVIKSELIDIKEDGSFRLNLKYFDYQNGRSMTSSRFEALFGGVRRTPEQEITKREMDLAASVQKVVEEVIIKLSRTAKALSGGIENLVLAGGVALNCVANGVLSREGIFKNIWVQPAAGDAGGALGVALLAYYHKYNERRVERKDIQKGSYLGPGYTQKEIMNYLVTHSIPYVKYEYGMEFYHIIADLLKQQKIIGLFEGRMEFGPRALGNRSIIADPRSETMQSRLNLSIKYRESFRPFAPAVLRERCSEYFDFEGDSPYMLFCGYVKGKQDTDFDLAEYFEKQNDMTEVIKRKRSDFPAVTHIDYSARIQTVTEEGNPIFYRIIKQFEKETGCGMVINTSFNVRGEPIVCTPEDAYHCFMNTEMDVLVLGNFILYKEEQPERYKRRDVYELD